MYTNTSCLCSFLFILHRIQQQQQQSAKEPLVIGNGSNRRLLVTTDDQDINHLQISGLQLDIEKLQRIILAKDREYKRNMGQVKNSIDQLQSTTLQLFQKFQKVRDDEERASILLSAEQTMLSAMPGVKKSSTLGISALAESSFNGALPPSTATRFYCPPLATTATSTLENYNPDDDLYTDTLFPDALCVRLEQIGKRLAVITEADLCHPVIEVIEPEEPVKNFVSIDCQTDPIATTIEIQTDAILVNTDTQTDGVAVRDTEQDTALDYDMLALFAAERRANQRDDHTVKSGSKAKSSKKKKKSTQQAPKPHELVVPERRKVKETVASQMRKQESPPTTRIRDRKK
jgi:hypothetical protein